MGLIDVSHRWISQMDLTDGFRRVYEQMNISQVDSAVMGFTDELHRRVSQMGLTDGSQTWIIQMGRADETTSFTGGAIVK